MFLEELHLCCL